MPRTRKEDALGVLLRGADAAYRGFPEFASWAARPIDPGPWQAALQSFESEKQQASPATLQRALDFALRAAAVDSGAIEGLYDVDRGITFSVAAQIGTWESDLEARGPNARALFEAQLAGLELVVDAVAAQAEIGEAWLRRLHEVLCGPQATYRVRTAVGWQDQPLPKGRCKTHPNHVRLEDGGVHAYSPVDRTGEEVHRLVSQLRSAAFQEAHPAVQAAYAHYGLVAVHPFADGNGRVARALASVFTYRACSIPFVVYADQKVRYLGSLSAADVGSFERFTTFVLQTAVDTMNELTVLLRDARTPTVRESSRVLGELYGRSTATAHELDAIAGRVAGALQDELERLLAKAPLPVHVTFTVEPHRSHDPPNETGFRRVRDGGAGVKVTLRARAPHAALVSFAYRVVVAIGGEPFYAFQIEQAGVRTDHTPPLRLRLEQVYPSLTGSFRRQLEPWVRLGIKELLAELAIRAGRSPEDPRQ